MENCKQYSSLLPVCTFVVIATKFIGLSTKVNDVRLSPNCYLTTCEVWNSFNIKLSQDPDFTVSFSIATILWFIKMKSDVHYLVIGIYPAVKFQICSLNTFRFIAGSIFPDERIDGCGLNLKSPPMKPVGD